MFNPHFDRQIAMVNNFATKHIGELDYLVLDWYVLELFDKHGEVIQQPVPKLVMDFKG